MPCGLHLNAPEDTMHVMARYLPPRGPRRIGARLRTFRRTETERGPDPFSMEGRSNTCNATCPSVPGGVKHDS